ncbi:hypothetical protein [Frankia sp. AgB32]|uniref:hypothetical protein n=1 Tax=Frankia sp. AgB32 TaxID=631119 RepID=UPI00200BB304|nr:hypothetical protein [Frankia sp. AgB32]MCK9895280.1 hypothetical protein [Frankia sp. AgB32]
MKAILDGLAQGRFAVRFAAPISFASKFDWNDFSRLGDRNGDRLTVVLDDGAGGGEASALMFSLASHRIASPSTQQQAADTIRQIKSDVARRPAARKWCDEVCRRSLDRLVKDDPQVDAGATEELAGMGLPPLAPARTPATPGSSPSSASGRPADGSSPTADGAGRTDTDRNGSAGNGVADLLWPLGLVLVIVVVPVLLYLFYRRRVSDDDTEISLRPDDVEGRAVRFRGHVRRLLGPSQGVREDDEDDEGGASDDVTSAVVLTGSTSAGGTQIGSMPAGAGTVGAVAPDTVPVDTEALDAMPADSTIADGSAGGDPIPAWQQYRVHSSLAGSRGYLEADGVLRPAFWLGDPVRPPAVGEVVTARVGNRAGELHIISVVTAADDAQGAAE